MKILVTGGCGFIGSNFIRYLLKSTNHEIINLDALTYAGNSANLKDYEDNERYVFVQGRIEDREKVKELIDDVDSVINFAAETHVDRSIFEPSPFLTTNIIGTQTLLEASKTNEIESFVHISTDEVYGSLETDDLKFTEDMPLLPNSPYSASKASADLIVRGYYKTYGLPATVVRPSNNYGPYQYPEKFIPLMITNLMEGRPVPIYGEGLNVRDWLFVEDACEGIYQILNKGKKGEIYNIGGDCEKRNIDVAKTVLKLMGKDESSILHVKDRPGHDYRYALDNTKIKREIGWEPSVSFEMGIKKTIDWYVPNEQWWRPLKEKLVKESKGFWS